MQKQFKFICFNECAEIKKKLPNADIREMNKIIKVTEQKTGSSKAC